MIQEQGCCPSPAGMQLEADRRPEGRALKTAEAAAATAAGPRAATTYNVVLGPRHEFEGGKAPQRLKRANVGHGQLAKVLVRRQQNVCAAAFVLGRGGGA